MFKDIKFFLDPLSNYGKIIDLINLVQPHIQWSRDHFEWQCLNNPEGKAKVWVAEYLNSIIGTYMAIPHQFNIRNQVTTSWMVQGVTTHPDFRGLGVMNELAKLCNESINSEESILNFTFPNELSHRSFVRYGWQEVCQIPLRVLGSFENVSRKHEEGTSIIEPMIKFSEEIDDLWHAAQSELPFAVSRHSEFLS